MKIRVVIAEDQAMVRGALAALLETEDDIEVSGQAADGRAALDQVITLRPEVLLTDIEMPDMNGFQFAEAVRSDPRTAELPIIGLSSVVSAEAIERVRVGGSAVIVARGEFAIP